MKTLSRIFVSAPCSTKNSTTRRCPCLAARCRGVLPIYQTLYWKSDLHQSLLYIVKGVDIGTSAEEEANDLEVAFLGRDMQRRAAVVLNGNKHVYCLFHQSSVYLEPSVDVRSSGNQSLHLAEVSPLNGRKQLRHCLRKDEAAGCPRI